MKQLLTLIVSIFLVLNTSVLMAGAHKDKPADSDDLATMLGDDSDDDGDRRRRNERQERQAAESDSDDRKTDSDSDDSDSDDSDDRIHAGAQGLEHRTRPFAKRCIEMLGAQCAAVGRRIFLRHVVENALPFPVVGDIGADKGKADALLLTALADIGGGNLAIFYQAEKLGEIVLGERLFLERRLVVTACPANADNQTKKYY